MKQKHVVALIVSQPCIYKVNQAHNDKVYQIFNQTKHTISQLVKLTLELFSLPFVLA
jgi:hypothetical protein